MNGPSQLITNYKSRFHSYEKIFMVYPLGCLH